MGAVTALLHGDRDPSIACMVLDSPFCSLDVLVKELAVQYKVPGFIAGVAMKIVGSTIQSKAKFSISDLNPLAHV